MKMLRLPASNTVSLIFIRSPAPVSSCLFALLQCKPLQEPGSFIAGTVGFSDWSNTGSPRFLEIPSYTFALLSDPGWSVWSYLIDQNSAVPIFRRMKTPCFLSISRLNHTALVSAAYASSSALPHSHAKLASGCWSGFTGRESNPLESNTWFLPRNAGFPHAQIYPGAT
jgi:hypothetical protein